MILINKMIKQKKGSVWIWILIIIILVAVGAGVYFLLSGGNSIPRPPALPSG